jgi:nucleoside-diphosphate-sugar epimerase
VAVRRQSNRQWLQEQAIHLHEVDFSDADTLTPAVIGMDVVYHLAALISAPNWDTFYRANCLSTKNLLEACARQAQPPRRFVLVSSIGAVGPSPRAVYLNEDAPCQPVSDYGRSKLQAEQIVREYQNKIPCTIVRPPNVIGPRQRELYQALRLIKRRIIPQIGNGDIQTSLCYVRDLVQGILLAGERAEAAGRIYIIADQCGYSWRDVTSRAAEILGIGRLSLKIPHWLQFAVAALAEIGAAILGRSALLSRETLRTSRQQYWLFDGSRITRELGFQTTTALTEALQQTISWYRQQRLL